MTIEIVEEAKEEIEAAARYLNRRSPGLGDRFLTEVADRLEAVDGIRSGSRNWRRSPAITRFAAI